MRNRRPGGRIQVPAPFEYERATSVEHALALLARHGPHARVLAGGHSLLPMMKLRLITPETLVDINGVSALTGIDVDANELRIGALTRHAELLASPSPGRAGADRRRLRGAARRRRPPSRARPGRPGDPR